MSAASHLLTAWPLAAVSALLLVGCGSDLPKKAPASDSGTGSGTDSGNTTKKYTATATLTSNVGTGSISPASQQVEENRTVTFSLSPATGKGVDKAEGCGGSLSNDKLTYITAPLQSDCTVSVSFRDVPTISRFEPTNITRLTPTEVTFTGTTLPAQLAVLIADQAAGSCGPVQRLSATTFKSTCTFEKLGQHLMLVQDTTQATPQVVYSASLNVTSNISKVTWLTTGDSTREDTNSSNSNPAAPYNIPVGFTVRGSNLTPGLQFAISQCTDVQELGGGSTARIFRCTFKATASDPWITEGYKVGSVRTPDGSQLLLTFKVRNSVDASLHDLSTLVATGITWCANTEALPLICSQDSLKTLYGLGQDGEVQAGVTPQFTPIGTDQNRCIKDNRSGLVWEIKSTAGSPSGASYWRDPAHGYTWYATSANGGNPGTTDYSVSYPNVPVGDACAGTLGSTCNTQAYLARLNAEQFCGRSNWRLPTRQELFSLVDFAQQIGTPQYFGQGTDSLFADQMTSWVWTQSTTAQAGLAWAVHFGLGDTGRLPKNSNASIRAVSDQ
jgi:hypothetical protein